MYSSQEMDLVKHSLEKILMSEGFVQAPQLCNFLTYVVDKTLLSEAEEIKGYSIGVDALGRNADFDPQLDSTVRVMAGRLRQALKTYNEHNEKTQDVSISIPKGSYVPEFDFSQSFKSIDSISGKHPAPVSPYRAYLQGGFAALLILVIGWSLWLYLVPLANKNQFEAGSHRPNVHIARIGVSLNTNKDLFPEWFSKQEAIEGLLNAFSKFNEFEIFRSSASDANVPARFSRKQTNADYHFSALIGRAGTSTAIRAFLSLTRNSDGAIIWSDTLTVLQFGNPGGTNSTKVAGKIISPLVSPYGVIYGDISGQNSSTKIPNCIHLAYTYFATESTKTFSEARNCIDNAIRVGQTSSSLHAVLTFLHIENYRKNITGQEVAHLENAKENARIAIQLDPQNARAHQAVFAIQKVLRHPTQATKAAAQAIKLNPFDSDILGDYAAYLISLGKFEKASPLLRQAHQLNPSTPVWLKFFTFLHADMTGKHKEADIIAANINPDQSPLAALAVALSAVRMNDSKRANFACKSLNHQEPDFIKDPAAALKRRGFGEAIIVHISSVFNCEIDKNLLSSSD